jgi:hypothetical protein
MSVAVFAAVAALHFVTTQGATVTVDHAKALSNKVAAARASEIANFVWRDLCSGAPAVPCNVGSYYRISIDLAPQYCLVHVEGERANLISPSEPARFLETAWYRCDVTGRAHRDDSDVPDIEAPRRPN